VRRLLALLSVPVAALCAVGAASGSTAGGDVSPRVVGPDRADAIAAEWPFATFLNPGYAYLCGGSVISSRWVLTAGHCLYDGSGNPLSAFPASPGAYNRNALPAGQLADAALAHPSYSPAGNPWDFALLRMPAPTSATPVALPAPSEDSAVDALRTAVPATGPRNGRIAGWGLTTNGGSTSTILQHAAGGVPLLDDAVCAGGGSYGSAFQPATMVCAGGYPDPLGPPAPDDANDTCQGDSGGPLAVDLSGRRVVVGVTSWGYSCGDPRYPGVYAKVSAARDWICDTVTSPTAISAVVGSSTATAQWSPDATCPWQDATVQVTASPGGATATAPVSAGAATVGGLAAGTRYTLSARVVSATGAAPPAATTAVSTPAAAPAPAPAPTSSVATALPAPCSQTFYQQAKRTWRTQAAPNGTSAVRVLSRIRVYEDAPGECRTNLTFIFRDTRTGARLTQLPGSTLGYRRLVGRDFSAPVISWPTNREFKYAGADPTGLNRDDARLVLVSYLKRTSSMPAQSNVELLVVRRIPGDPTQAESATNPEYAQKNAFGIGVGWAVVS